MEKNANEYVLINRINGAEIITSKKYLSQWFARGFEVKYIIVTEDSMKKAKEDTSNRLNKLV